MKKSLSALLSGIVVTLCLVIFPLTADALIIIEPVPGQPPNPRALRLIENNVKVRITDRVAEVTAEFVYENTGRFDLEGTFLFPLPTSAAVDDFSLFVNGEEIKAVLLDRQRARQIYENIVRRRRDPALLEFADQQLLQASIFPITPRDGARVRLYYTHPVPADFGTADFVYPLAVEKLEAGGNCQITIDVELHSAQPLKTVYSPTHPIDLKQPDEHTARITCLPHTAGQRSTDFHLLVATAREKVAAHFLTCRDQDGQQYFMGMISPGTYRDDEILPKDIVFCLDRSGSMEGKKIEQAKAALRFCVNRLNPDDRFGLVIFNSDVEIFRPQLSSADAASKKAAIEYFDRLPATGGTFIDGALNHSLAIFEDNSRPRYLVFLTDGLPTVGTRNAKEILRHVAESNVHHARIFAWGVGYDLNAGLVNDLAANTKGVASYVEPDQDLEVELSHFFERINRPVLADCKLHFQGVKITEMYPANLPDLFAGSEVIIVGRYEGGSPVTVNLSGKQGNTLKQFVFETQFAPAPDKYTFLPKLWAGRRIGHLLEDMRRFGETQEVIDEVVDLSKKFGIITPYTSFLAAPEEPALAERGVDGLQRYGMPAPTVDLGTTTRVRGSTGKSIQYDVASTRRTVTHEKLQSMPVSDVDDAMRAQVVGANRKQEVGDLEEREMKQLTYGRTVFKAAGDKSFTLRENFWTDADLLTGAIPADTIKVEKFSNAYFELLKLVPALQSYFSVGENVIVIYRGVMIIVADTGETEFEDRWLKLLR